jgi:predicted NAD/FAD-dependent oxidoreductase
MTGVTIIGAGIAGLACAGRLAKAGLTPLVLDKGRGIGGRVATRRVGTMQFDHGAQYVTARGADFGALLASLAASGQIRDWDDGSGSQRMVGAPGMSSLARAMAAGLDVRQDVQVTRVRRVGTQWLLTIDDTELPATQLVITTPAPQAAALLGQAHPLSARLAGIAMEPCLTLMAAIDAPAPFASLSSPDEPLSWIAQDSSKPGRPDAGPVAWVAQASPAFSAEHLELAPDAIADLMTPMLCRELGVSAGHVVHAQAHRWRYARVAAPLGQPFLADDSRTLLVGGDWCLGQRIEDAWASGIAMADELLARI